MPLDRRLAKTLAASFDYFAPRRVSGTIPAPVFFGVLIDKTCQLWQHECHQTGSCLFYDNTTMGHYLLGLAIICKVCEREKSVKSCSHVPLKSLLLTAKPFQICLSALWFR